MESPGYDLVPYVCPRKNLPILQQQLKQPEGRELKWDDSWLKSDSAFSRSQTQFIPVVRQKPPSTEAPSAAKNMQLRYVDENFKHTFLF